MPDENGNGVRVTNREIFDSLTAFKEEIRLKFEAQQAELYRLKISVRVGLFGMAIAALKILTDLGVVDVASLTP